MVNAAYDAREIRQYNRKRGIRSNIQVNTRSRKHPTRGRSFWFDSELYNKHNAVERFFSWIEAFKKIVPRYAIRLLIPGIDSPGMCRHDRESIGMTSETTFSQQGSI
ncbi:MAG: transposase [Methanoculleus bourgensis]|uniref:Transposase n=1 Tax=Methanoculleus bourgensis TaxID=83986 RepID=A0A8T7H0S0_9EURY|nr:transposase [Methanoculleus bourgensis]